MGKNNKTITLNSGQCKPSAHLCEQVNDLMDLGMQIKDYDFALKFLFENEYYRFRGYCYQFTQGDKLDGNISFDDILDIYYFDDELRQLLLKYLRYVELSIKSIVSYYHTIKYGSLCYLDDKLFINKANHMDFISKAKKEIGRSDELFIRILSQNLRIVLLLCVQCSIMFTNNYGGGFMKSANVYARIEPEIKNKAEDILKKIGIPASVAINMYYKQIIVSNGIPFKVTADMPKQINLDSMTKDEFDSDMERRYQEALNEEGIEANTYFQNFKKRNKVNA